MISFLNEFYDDDEDIHFDLYHQYESCFEQSFFLDDSNSGFDIKFSTIEPNKTISNATTTKEIKEKVIFENALYNTMEQMDKEEDEYKKIYVSKDNNFSKNLSTNSSSNNDMSVNISLINNKNRKDIFEVHNSENSISELFKADKSSNNLFCRKRKRIKEKTEAKINKTEDISKPVFREFRKDLKNKCRFENNKEFWKQFFGKKSPPFSFNYKGEKKEFNSFNRKFFEFIMSVDDMYNLYEKFLNDKKYQITQKEKRRKKQKDIKKNQAYENYLNNFHIFYSKEKDENCLNFEFE